MTFPDRFRNGPKQVRNIKVIERDADGNILKDPKTGAIKYRKVSVDRQHVVPRQAIKNSPTLMALHQHGILKLDDFRVNGMLLPTNARDAQLLGINQHTGIGDGGHARYNEWQMDLFQDLDDEYDRRFPIGRPVDPEDVREWLRREVAPFARAVINYSTVRAMDPGDPFSVMENDNRNRPANYRRPDRQAIMNSPEGRLGAAGVIIEVTFDPTKTRDSLYNIAGGHVASQRTGSVNALGDNIEKMIKNLMGDGDGRIIELGDDNTRKPVFLSSQEDIESLATGNTRNRFGKGMPDFIKKGGPAILTVGIPTAIAINALYSEAQALQQSDPEQARKKLLEAEDLTARMIGSIVGEGLGTVGGAVLGASGGAALGGVIGSFVAGPLGAAVGTAVGGATGGFAGGLIVGSLVEGYIADLVQEATRRIRANWTDGDPLVMDSIYDVLRSAAWTTGVQCFPGGTLISMADGSRCPIEDVQVGDWVLAFDERAMQGRGGLVARRVSRLYRNRASQLYRLSASDDPAIDLVTTPEHVFLTAAGTFDTIDALLSAGGGRTAVVLEDGRVVEVTGVLLSSAEMLDQAGAVETAAVAMAAGRTDPPAIAVPTFNFEVEDLHTYVAGGVRVHNMSGAHDFMAYIAAKSLVALHNDGFSVSDFSTRSSRADVERWAAQLTGLTQRQAIKLHTTGTSLPTGADGVGVEVSLWGTPGNQQYRIKLNSDGYVDELGQGIDYLDVYYEDGVPTAQAVHHDGSSIFMRIDLVTKRIHYTVGYSLRDGMRVFDADNSLSLFAPDYQRSQNGQTYDAAELNKMLVTADRLQMIAADGGTIPVYDLIEAMDRNRDGVIDDDVDIRCGFLEIDPEAPGNDRSMIDEDLGPHGRIRRASLGQGTEFVRQSDQDGRLITQTVVSAEGAIMLAGDRSLSAGDVTDTLFGWKDGPVIGNFSGATTVAGGIWHYDERDQDGSAVFAYGTSWSVYAELSGALTALYDGFIRLASAAADAMLEAAGFVADMLWQGVQALWRAIEYAGGAIISGLGLEGGLPDLFLPQGFDGDLGEALHLHMPGSVSVALRTRSAGRGPTACSATTAPMCCTASTAATASAVAA